jgi:hypothetical protein
LWNLIVIVGGNPLFGDSHITFVQPMVFLVDSFQTPTKHLTGIEKKSVFKNMSNFEWEFEIWKVVNQEKKWFALGIKTELSWHCLFLKLDRREKKPQNRFENVFCRYDLKTKEMKLSQGSTKCGFILETMFNLTIYTTKSRLLKFHNCNHQNRICRTTHTLSTDCGKKRTFEAIWSSGA